MFVSHRSNIVESQGHQSLRLPRHAHELDLDGENPLYPGSAIVGGSR